MSTEAALTNNVAQSRVETCRFLCGSKYDEWSTNLRLALKARKKFRFADGSIPQPKDTSGDLEDCIANNALVVSWMKLTIDESQTHSLYHIDDSHEFLTHSHKHFSVKNGQHVQHLKTELATCRQKGTAIEAYYGKLAKLWKSLSDYQQAKTLEEVIKKPEEDKLHQFLMGIDEIVYGNVKSKSKFSSTIQEAYIALSQDKETKN